MSTNIPPPVIYPPVNATNQPTPVAAPTITTTAHIITPMPIPHSQYAPTFDGKYAQDFLDQIEQHGIAAGAASLDVLVDYIVRYSSDRVKEVISHIREFDRNRANKSWTEASAKLLLLYGEEDATPNYTEQQLRAFCKTNADRPYFNDKKAIDLYLREFITIAGPLVKKQRITQATANYYFVSGISSIAKDWFLNQCPVANRTRDTAPEISETIKILKARFDPESLIFEPWRERVHNQNQVKFDTHGNRLDSGSHADPPTSSTSTQPNIQPRPPTPIAKSAGDSTMADLARQMEQLRIQIAQAQGQSAPQQLRQRTTEPPCFICDQVGTHALHPRHCPRTAELIDRQLIKIDPNTNRYIQANGQDLPKVPRGFRGGVYTFLIGQADGAVQQTRSASAMGLSYGAQQLLNDDYFAVSSLNVNERNAEPVTRSGKDTSARHDPIGRPRKNAEPTPNAPNPAPTRAPPAPAAPKQAPAPAPAPIPTPPNPINRQDGWKNSRAPNRNTQNEDIIMRDAKKTQDKYHITSTIQERAKPAAVFEEIMQTKISVPILELLGSSPALQKLVSDATRARREYTTNQAEYFEPDANTEVYQASQIQSEHRQLYVEPESGAEDFLVRYSNAVARAPPSSRYFAMTTGILTILIGTVEVRALVDTGSELNLASASIPAKCSLAVDFQGQKWSLKGIHGDPERLGGCATDVPMRIGQHDFSHHLFISHTDLGPYDIILGQPFLQWFAARIDYERGGSVSLFLWKNGDRRAPPTIMIAITNPDDPRNATAINNKHNHHGAYVEEIPDEEDF